MKKILILFFLSLFVFAGIGLAEEQKFQFDQKNLEKAYKLVDQKQYVKALVILDKLTTASEEQMSQFNREDKIVYADVYFNIGFCYGKLGNDDKKLEYYNQALSIFTEHQATLYDLAKHYKDKNEDDMAIGVLEKLININATHDWALLMLGDIYNKKGDFIKSKDYYKEAARLGNEEAESKLNQEAESQQ